MNIPEKIYIDKSTGEFDDYWSIYQNNDSIEYIRKDAFVEKIAIWFNNNFMVHDEYRVISDSFDTKEEMFDDFVKFIES